MNRILICAAAVTLIGTTAFAKANPNVTDKTIAYWPFGEYGFKDASGNGYDLVADEAHVKTRMTGGAIHFDGKQSICACTNFTLVGAGDITVEFWTRFTAADRLSSNNTVIMLLETDSEPGGSVNGTPTRFCVDYNEDDDCGNHHADWPGDSPYGQRAPGTWGHGFAGCMLAQLHHTEGNNLMEARTWYGNEARDTYFEDNEWHHIAVEFDHTQSDEKVVTMYVDGKDVFYGGDGYLHVPYETGEEFVWDPNITRLYVGCRYGGQTTFAGYMDDIRITKGLLDPSEFIKVHTPAPEGISLRVR